MKDCVELFKENKNMAVEKKLRVMISFYKNQCPPVIMWNKRNLSEKVLLITYTLELKIFVVTTFCESIFFRQSGKPSNKLWSVWVFFASTEKWRPNKQCLREENLFFCTRYLVWSRKFYIWDGMSVI